MRVLAISALVLGFGAGCAAGGSSGAEGTAGDGGAGAGAGGQPTLGETPSKLEFEMVPDLPARGSVRLTVRALPAKTYHVRFALPTTGGDPLDAVLDDAETDTDASGIASVQLTAPSAPTTFNVRASAGSLSTLLTLSVTDAGFASLQVRRANADSNFRQITTWVASAHPNKTCADLPGIPPEDGPLLSLPASSMGAPQLDNVPAGTPLAVTLRSGHFVGGCTSIDKVPPGTPDQPLQVLVTVLDRPIDLDASPLNVSFNLASPEATWSKLLQSSSDAVLQAMRGTSVDDVDALLDAMREASASSRQAFESARQAEGWDGLLAVRWGAGASNKLHDLAGGWLSAGRQWFNGSDHLFTGTLDPIRLPGGQPAQHGAEFTLLSVAGVDGAQSGFIDRAQVSWSANSDDTLVVGLDLYLIQSRLVEALAEAAELQDHPAATSAAAQLASLLDCPGVGEALAKAGVDMTVAYDGCDAACLTSLCESGVATLWRRGGEATGLSPARLSAIATGRARVGDDAEVVGLNGTWIGSLKVGDALTSTGGGVTAVAPGNP